MLSCQFCKHVGKIWVLLVSCLPKKCSLIDTFRLVAWDKPSQTAADSVDWKTSYTPDVDHETAGAEAAGACVKALDSRHIVCFEAVIYELMVAKSKLTDHRVFDDFSSPAWETSWSGSDLETDLTSIRKGQWYASACLIHGQLIHRGFTNHIS